MPEDYSDRVQECPKCGNKVGHTPNADYCIQDPDAMEGQDSDGCGWLQVIR